MKTKHIIGIIIIALVIGGIYYLNPSQNVIVVGGYPASSNYQFYSINALRNGNLAPGFYDTEGYVVKKYVCPQCPVFSQCKSCMENNIVISEKNIPLEIYSLSDTELIVLVDHSQRFELGKKYRFSIQFLESKNMENGVNDVKLIGYNIAESHSK